MVGTFMEEYQTLADEIPQITYARVAHNLPEHPMINGHYCFVRDTVSEQDHLKGCNNEIKMNVRRERSKISLPILGLSQASFRTLRKIVQKCATKIPLWLLLNVRSDPCIFSSVDDDWLPYTLRDYQNIQQPVTDPHQTGRDIDTIEVKVRNETIGDLKALQQQSFYFYDDITYLRLNFPHWRFPSETEVDELITVLKDMCNAILPKNSFVQAVETYDSVERLMGVLVSGRKIHDGSIQLGMTMAHLILRQLYAVIVTIHPTTPLAGMFEKKPIQKKPVLQKQKNSEEQAQEGVESTKETLGVITYKKRSESQFLTPLHQRVKQGKFQFVRQVGRYLPFMVQIKEEVDRAIDDCDDVVNLREEILEALLELESIMFSFDMDKKTMAFELRERLLHQLERYYLLICFNAYLRDQLSLRFSLQFTEWMRRHPKLYQILVYLDISEWYTTADLLKHGKRVLVADNGSQIDELCTRRTTGLANFRQLVGWPIYGASQPDGPTVQRIHDHVTIAYWNVALHGVCSEDGALSADHARVPVSMPNMIWVCLRNEYVIGAGGETYKWRFKNNFTETIPLKGISGVELEEFEEKFVEGIKKLATPCKPFRYIMDTDSYEQGEPLATNELQSMKQMFKSVFDKPHCTATDQVIDSQALNIPQAYLEYVNKHAEFHRIPLPKCGPPPPIIFDQILRLILNNTRGLFTSAITAQSLVDASAGMGRRHVKTKRNGGSLDGSIDHRLSTSKDAVVDRIASTNLIFFCENGCERTSLAMTIAGLVYCHVVGFAFGYRVMEEERISLRGAKYTKGDFEVRQYLPSLHFSSLFRKIYLLQSRDETDPVKKDALKRESLAYLEEYFFLILFNMYLHECQPTRWRCPFEVWMEQVTQRCNYMELLDNFGFTEFEKLDHLRCLRERWKSQSTNESLGLGIV
ncbi:hypothetical protein EG68_00872 [Paragonimus skrjabini miyazakii]|uniref:Paladin n=1 Tax=Paragonimus skrjabini miyazakii TaxID=59628 RepID=A0A8S9Z3W2_9TREM|nr:hypothetical protein EG68_00872 [Paragonimus skrjabini miyazakii]